MDEHQIKLLKRILELTAGILVIIWGIVIVYPITQDPSIIPIDALTIILTHPLFLIAAAVFVVFLLIHWSQVVKKINPETVKKGLRFSPLAFLIAVLLGMVFVLMLPGGFLGDFASSVESITGPNPVMAYILGSGFYSQNAINPLMTPVIVGISPSIGTALGWMTIPSLLTWFVTGFILGWFMKDWKSAVACTMITAAFLYLFVMIGTRILLMPPAVVGAPEFTVTAFVMLASAYIALIPAFAGLFAGYELYKHLST